MHWKGLPCSRGSARPALRVLGRRLGASLRRHRHALAIRLMENLAGWEKYDREFSQHQADLDNYVRLEFHAFIDYLDFYCSTADLTYKNLYIGEKLKQLYDPALTPEQDDANRGRVTDGDIRILCGHVGRDVGPAAAEVLESLLREIQGIVSARGRKRLDVLVIGDCLYLDVQGFLAPLALEDGITFRLTFLETRNPAEQRNALRRLAGRRFDLIFYSPFTYEYSPGLTALHNWRRSWAGRGRIHRVVCDALDDVARNLDLLASLHDVPTYVHNTVNVRRHDGRWLETTKTLLTRRTRRLARLEVNRRLAELIAARRAADAPLILFDEARLREHHDELTLGRIVYRTPVQHPAELGRLVAHHYREILAVHADLVGKKVVVCDLDNTLWKGEIGEGPVEHLGAVQGTLKELRHKGVLLAINSKNDPRHVRWDGAELSPDDFVAIQINWDSKVANLHRIRAALNLEFKDFVFLDDRADQRALVRAAIPEVWVLDATAPRVREQLALWAAALPDQPKTDRTRLYRERQQRGRFLAEAAAVTEAEDPTTLLAQLEIRVEIRDALPAELPRVAELINRTNQFNLAGSRITLKEIREWPAAAGRRVVVVEASDKFGPMGLVCAVLLDLTGSELQIPVFVLSCRVFGYGIEDALLDAVKQLARAHRPPGGDLPTIRGAYRETAHNEPCRTVYPRHGFCWDGRAWVLQPGTPADAAP